MSWSLVGSAGTVVNSATSPMTANAGQASTAGNLLTCRVVVTGNSGAPTLPTGWTLRASIQPGTAPFASVYIFDYTNNPGGISSVSVTFTPGHAAAIVTEYTCTNVASVTADQTGTTTGSIVSALNITTSAGNGTANDLAVAGTAVLFSSLTTATLSTTGTSWTRQGAWNNGVNSTQHASFDHNVGAAGAAGATATDPVSISATGSGHMSGAIVTYAEPAASFTGTAAAPLVLGVTPAGTFTARSGTAPAGPLLPLYLAAYTASYGNPGIGLVLGVAVTGTSTARSGTASAALTLHATARTISMAALTLGATATGSKHGADTGGTPAAPLTLGATATGQATAGAIAAARLFLGTPRYPLHLGGAITQAATLGGTLALTAAHWADSGTLTFYTLSGTAVLTTYTGQLNEWTMTPINIVLAEFNDEQLTVTITNGGNPVNLTGYTIQALFKTVAGAADSDPTVTLTLSSAGPNPAITIINAAAGQCVINLPAADMQNNSIGFYRIDTLDTNGLRNTAIYGTVSVTLL